MKTNSLNRFESYRVKLDWVSAFLCVIPSVVPDLHSSVNTASINGQIISVRVMQQKHLSRFTEILMHVETA